MATSKKATTEVATKTNTAVLVSDGLMNMAEQDSAKINHGITMADTQIPYLLVLQSLSPQVSKASPNRVDGAEEGDLYNSGTGELYDGNEGITIIPCAFVRKWTEWGQRNKGGGFVQHHDTAEILNHCSRDEKGYDIRNDNGNTIMPTYYYYCILLNNETGAHEPIIIAMSRTAMATGRRWNNLIQSLRVQGKNGLFNPPMFMCQYKFSTEPKSNAHGAWYVPRIVSAGLIDDAELYKLAKTFHDQVSSGLLKAADPMSDFNGGSNSVDFEDSPM